MEQEGEEEVEDQAWQVLVVVEVAVVVMTALALEQDWWASFGETFLAFETLQYLKLPVV